MTDQSQPDKPLPEPTALRAEDGVILTFDGFGTAAISGPHADTLANAFTALPELLRLMTLTVYAVKTRQLIPMLGEMERALSNAGFPFDDRLVATSTEEEPLKPSNFADYLASVLVVIARDLQRASDDRSNLRAPVGLKIALMQAQGTIREALRRTGYADLLPNPYAPQTAAQPPAAPTA